MTVIYIGLGSNLDNPAAQIAGAMTELAVLPETDLVKCSSLYRSAPLGPQDQPEFINAVVQLETGLSAAMLLTQLQQIEQTHGRTRAVHWGPRTLDLDLLLYGNMKIKTENLTVPHPHIATRSFVLCPLLEIDPEIEIPGLGYAGDLFRSLNVDPPARINFP